jgi:selenocysteine lyase/cysteine desulfurase
MPESILYLNHAGTSWPKPPAVSSAIASAVSASPVEWAEHFDEFRAVLARYFGVQDPDQILLTPGCTSALHVAVEDAFLEPGQRVLTTKWEHHALHRPLVKRAISGVRLEYIPAGGGNSQEPDCQGLDLDWLRAELRKGDVALVALTAACNVTGEIFPFEKVVQMARAHRVAVLLDAAQIVGWLAVDFSKLGASMVAFGGHKGLQGPWGIGGLYISADANLQCLTASCQVPAKATTRRGATLSWSPRPGYCDVGSVDQFALAGLAAGIGVLSRWDAAANLSAARRQIEVVRESIHDVPGVTCYGPSDPAQRLPTLAFSVAGHSSQEVATECRNRGLIVGSGLHCAPLAHDSLGSASTGLVRISAGIQQTDDQIEEAARRLRSVLTNDV